MGFRTGIVGSGAIGIYYGAKLAHAGNDVHFLMRGDLTEARRHGLSVRGPVEDIHVSKINCYNSTSEIGPCDLVLIAIKTTSNPQLVELIPPLLRPGTMLVTLQNGLGNDEFLAGHFGGKRVLGGLCFVCLSRVARIRVERYDYGNIVLGEHEGEPQQRTHDLAAMFKRAGIRCEVTNNLALEQWRKLVWNIPLNALSVLAGGLDTSEILADDVLRAATLTLMEEVIAGANKCGQPLSQEIAAEQIKRTEAMPPYVPSTLADWKAGRPLEVKAIWGEPVRRAIAAGAEMPRTQFVYGLLKAMDRNRQAAFRRRTDSTSQVPETE